MALVVEEDVAADPADVGLFGAQTVVPGANGDADAVEETGRLILADGRAWERGDGGHRTRRLVLRWMSLVELVAGPSDLFAYAEIAWILHVSAPATIGLLVGALLAQRLETLALHRLVP